MKSLKGKKLILDNSMLEEEFFEDTQLIGIVCPRPSYQFIWQLNQSFNYSFERCHDFEVCVKEIFFEVFRFEEKEKMVEHFIFTNRKKTHYLLEEAKNIDFIWMIKGSYLDAHYAIALPNFLKEIKMIDYCFMLNASQLKSKQHLII